MSDFSLSTPSGSDALAWRIFHQRPGFMAVLDRDGVVREVNDAVRRAGFSREQFLGRAIAETPLFADDPAWHRTWRARLAEVCGSGEPCGYEDVIDAPDGSQRSFEATVSPIFDRDGQLEYVLVEAQDTTEQLQAELGLRERERRSHDLLDALPVLAWSIDEHGECDFVNQRWLDELGSVPLRDGRPDWLAVIHPDDRTVFALAWHQALASATPFSGAFRIVGVSGAARRCDVRIAPVRGDDGSVARWSAVAVDVPPEPRHTQHSVIDARD